MADVIKLRKGLTINLKGCAKEQILSLKSSKNYALVPSDFVGIVPKVVVKVGDHVKVGDFLFVNKNSPSVGFASPVSGHISEIARGERRKVLYIMVESDKEQEYLQFAIPQLSSLTGEQVKDCLLKAGLFGYINQLPYAVSTTPDTTPKAIFVSAFRDMPLQASFDYELKGQEHDFQVGLTVLSKIAKVYLSISSTQNNKALTEAKDVNITVFDGPCPAGNVGVQINHIDPINRGEVAWTVSPSSVITFGRLFNTGHVNLTRTIALAGSRVENPIYIKTLVGTPINDIIKGQLTSESHIRIINGNPLTGKTVTGNAFLGAHTSEVTAIPEGDNVNEMFGWIKPRLKEFSTSHSYFTWLFRRRKSYDLDARVKGGKRNIIMSGEYDRVLPMNIYSEFLIKSIITGNIDKQEQLGIYEVSPEDFALAEFVDSSKQPLQEIVRNGLDILRKENS